MNNRAGQVIRNPSGEFAYESFLPAPLPPEPPVNISGELLEKLIDANKKIAVLEGVSSHIPNIMFFCT